MILAIVLILFLLLISALAYACYRGHKQYELNRRLFAQRIQSPTVHDQAQLREKQHGFDASDDRQLPMLLRRQAD